jgi:pyruvate/2-oxoglutarate dehydrogenase complex dihydrolipoamide acyltransferase (E2) component
MPSSSGLSLILWLLSKAGPSKTEEAAPGEHYQVNHRIGPAAAKLLRESGLSADAVKPSGPHNIVTKGDVLAAIAAGVKPSKAPSKQARGPTHLACHP